VSWFDDIAARRAERRRIERRRRRTRIAVAAAVILAAAVAAVAVMRSNGSGDGHRAATAGSRIAVGAPPAARSQTGLPLARPAFALHGLAHPPLHVYFAKPPRAGLLVNLTTGQVLWALHPTQRVRIASLTKLMTAWLAVQHTTPRTRVFIRRSAVDVEGSKVGVLPVGRRVPIEPLLYGLLLPSGNDAANAIAQNVAGSKGRFVRLMNEEAAHLGLGCTRYSTPSGVVDRGNYSCAEDLAVLAHVDMSSRRIDRVVRTYIANLRFPIRSHHLWLENDNPLLIYHYRGTTGLKTGFTAAAGRCLVGTAERHGVRLAAIVLHSPSPGTQARRLLNAAFTQVYGQRPVREPAWPPGA